MGEKLASRERLEERIETGMNYLQMGLLEWRVNDIIHFPQRRW